MVVTNKSLESCGLLSRRDIWTVFEEEDIIEMRIRNQKRYFQRK